MLTCAPPSWRGKYSYFRELLEHIGDQLVNVSEGSEKDCKDFVTFQQLEKVWKHKRQGESGGTNLEDFEFCLGQNGLTTDLSKHLRFISILIWIHWDFWTQFEPIFGAALTSGILNGLERGNSLPWDVIEQQLHPTFSSWTRFFYPSQFIFTPLIIQEKQQVKHHQPHTRLPLVEQEDAEMRSGFFGKVSKVAIANGQFQMSPDEMNTKPKIVALKTFRSKEDFAFEKRNLEALLNCRKKHDHIAFHITALSIGNEFHIFSQWAELDLQKILDGEYGRRIQATDFTPWTLTVACQCLASALDFLHTGLELGPMEAYCCHLDLKPNNILIYRDQSGRHSLGIWKISDFGISQMKQKSGKVDNATSSGQLSSPTIPRRNAAEFQPPESECPSLFYSGRKVDIWSFGCILLTIFVFSQAGPTGVRALFTRKNQYSKDHPCNYFYCGTRNLEAKMEYFPKCVISDWVSDCSQSLYESTEWAKSWLTLVMEGMLVIDGRKRWAAKLVGDNLKEILRCAPEQHTGWRLSTDISPTAGVLQTQSRSPKGPPNDRESPGTRIALIRDVEDASNTSLSLIKAGKRPERSTTWVSRSNVDRDADFPPPAESRLATGPIQLPRSFTTDSSTSSHGINMDLPLSPPIFSHTWTFSTRGVDSEDSQSGNSSEFNKNLEVIKHELSENTEGVKEVVLTFAGNRVAVRLKDTVVVYGLNAVQFTPNSSRLEVQARIPGRWDEFCIAGQFVALKAPSNETPKFRLVRVVGDNVTDLWQSLPVLKGLLGFDVSCRGSVSLRFKNRLQVYDSNAIQRLDYSECGAASSDPFEAAAFSRDGKRLVALTWKVCLAWELREDDSFHFCFSKPHQLRNTDWSSFCPQLIPFTMRPGAIVHNPKERTVRIIDESGSYESSVSKTVSGDILRMALTPNDERLVIVRDILRRDSHKNSKIRKRTNGKFRVLTHAPIHPGLGKVSIGEEDPPLDLEMKSDRSESIRLVVGPDTGPLSIWLVSKSAEVREIPFAS